MYDFRNAPFLEFSSSDFDQWVEGEAGHFLLGPASRSGHLWLFGRWPFTKNTTILQKLQVPSSVCVCVCVRNRLRMVDGQIDAILENLFFCRVLVNMFIPFMPMHCLDVYEHFALGISYVSSNKIKWRNFCQIYPFQGCMTLMFLIRKADKRSLYYIALYK